MSDGIARKGDQDDLGYIITSDVQEDVKINGQPVAVKGSTMDDGVAIVTDCSTTVRVNGQPVALKGSQTEEHRGDGNRPRGVGTIIQSSDDTSAG